MAQKTQPNIQQSVIYRGGRQPVQPAKGTNLNATTVPKTNAPAIVAKNARSIQ